MAEAHIIKRHPCGSPSAYKKECTKSGKPGTFKIQNIANYEETNGLSPNNSKIPQRWYDA
jgi:hypothetical protein